MQYIESRRWVLSKLWKASCFQWPPSWHWQCVQGRHHKGICVSHQEGLSSSELLQRSKAENSNSSISPEYERAQISLPRWGGSLEIALNPFIFYVPNATGEGSIFLLCSKCWLVSVPGPSFKGQCFTKSSLPMAAIESSPMVYFYSDSCILLHCIQKEVPGHLG